MEIILRQFETYNSNKKKKKKNTNSKYNSITKTDQTSSSRTISCPNTMTLTSQRNLQSRFDPSSYSPSFPSLHNFERNHVRARLSRSLIRSVKHKRDRIITVKVCTRCASTSTSPRISLSALRVCKLT